MIKKYLTCERYLENYNKGDKTTVARLDDSGNVLVKECENYTWDDIGYARPRYSQNFLVGPIADTLHAYEELGYTPEELKEIVDKYKKLKERTLYISSAVNLTYGSLGSPFRKKLEDMREAEERRKRMEEFYKEFDLNVTSLYPQLMIASDKMLDEWAKKQIPKANPKPESKPKHPIVEKAIFNDPATIVFWKDGTKTVVKAQNGETYDPEKGLAMAFSKKMFGNEGNYYDQFTKLLPKTSK